MRARTYARTRTHTDTDTHSLIHSLTHLLTHTHTHTHIHTHTSHTISHLIYSLTARVVGAPEMISQPASSIFPVLSCPLGLGKLKACPFPDVVFPSLPLSVLSSSPFHCALRDGFGQTCWTGDMTIPLQFASLYDRQVVFVWSSCLLDLGTDFLVGSMVFV